MKIGALLVAALTILGLGALVWHLRQGGDDIAVSRGTTLTIYSTTDTGVFRPVIADFRRLHPTIAVRYEELDAAPLYRRYLDEAKRGQPRADLLLSSAMDLQAKLVNDGYAARHSSANVRALPSWARWRDEAFGFTFEPAVMVFNRDVMAGRELPLSRAELLETLRRDKTFWRNRVGTYDIERSSVGYLLASQDARQSSDYGVLVEAMADTGVQLEDNTATLLDQLEARELAMAYNLLGSYAQARADANNKLVIIYPRDYTLAVSRTAVLPKDGPNPAAAHLFLEYLLSIRGQRLLANESRLSAVREEVPGRLHQAGMAESQIGPLRPIPLGPGLLVYLDDQKRRRLLASWHGMIHSAR
ncbi:ABC transporter substrate-binding protein [Sphingomonas gilva]|uniref:ABC transporter substrate-binding protein n=1 Tax=Sphingomonas gilva TaxID=2305907 RepID=A0A396RP88_9SPHN|nr:ABC transporter substrate-binding protein [Sphingomonas gilva]RHW18219.1 ABC transporter substrate-binding protein [Sphingomonas gilva]